MNCYNPKIIIIGIMLILFCGVVGGSGLPPTLTNEYPIDNSIGIDILQSTVNVTIEDVENLFAWSIEGEYDGKYIPFTYQFDSSNGSKSANIITPLPYDTIIRWVVTSTDGTNYTNAEYSFTTRPAKLRENTEFTTIEQAIIGVVGIIVLVGFLYVVMKTDYAKKEGGLAKLLIGLIIALVLLTLIFGVL